MDLKDLLTKYQRPDAEGKSDKFFFGSPYDDKCPCCGAKVVSTCRCIIGHRICENDHSWYRDKQTGLAILGASH